MSEMATMLNSGLLEYLVKHAKPEDDFLVDMKKEAKEAGFPPIWIAPEQGATIQILLKLNKVKDLLEVGTQTGYSAITMARALPADGKLHTIDNDPAAIAFATTKFLESAVGDKITAYEGDALEVMKDFADASFDAAFIDADKDHYPHYLKESIRVVKPGGLIMVDNAFAYGQVLDDEPVRKQDDVWAIRAFNQMMARDDGIDGIIMPIGDGMWVAIRN